MRVVWVPDGVGDGDGSFFPSGVTGKGSLPPVSLMAVLLLFVPGMAGEGRWRLGGLLRTLPDAGITQINVEEGLL